jgi:cell division transport system ATP-binding protein
VSQERPTILRLDRAGMAYDAGEPVLTDLSLTLQAGALRFLAGPSGVGKTSFFRLIGLAHPPCVGTVELFGRDISTLTPAETASFRRRIGVVHQDLRLLDELTLFENAALPMQLAGVPPQALTRSVDELLNWVGLRQLKDVRPHRLSMGQRQLLAIARAIATRPALLLADEPTSHLDPARAERIMRVFVELHRLGTTVIVATHSQDLLRRWAFPVLRIEAGRLQDPMAPYDAAVQAFARAG